MSITDYLIDSALVLLVLIQIKERQLTVKSLVRPLIIVGIAVASYLHGIPTAGNDVVLVAVLALLGLLIGVASGQTVFMRKDEHGNVLGRAGWASGVFFLEDRRARPRAGRPLRLHARACRRPLT